MRNLIEWLEERVRHGGDTVAVEDAGGSVTFRELRARALGIAREITRREPGMVAIYLPKSADCLAAMLGALYGGRAYVPLDCRSPVKRTLSICDIVRPALIITDTGGYGQLSRAGADPENLFNLDTLAPNECGSDGDSLAERTIAETVDTDPAYLLFTSGSTGVPKGVVIPHRRVIDYINWAMTEFDVTSETVIGNQAPFYFTVSAMDIYLCLAAGARLCLIPEHLFAKPQKLLDHLREREITQIFWVSSAYHHVASSDALEPDSLPALREAWFVGEPMPPRSLAYWMERAPRTRFVNMYGSTETDMTVFHVFENGKPPERIPLGKPRTNAGVLLLCDDNAPAQIGEIGELCVRGPALALGYYGDTEKTDRAFVQNPLNLEYPEVIYKTGDLAEYLPDGELIFHGRRDHQFKHLGYRIEAGEIEAAAEKHGSVREAAVLYDADSRRIVLFYAPRGEADELALRRHLMELLPVYMIPTKYVRLEAMPHNANGKKDRTALAARHMTGGEKFER